MSSISQGLAKSGFIKKDDPRLAQMREMEGLGPPSAPQGYRLKETIDRTFDTGPVPELSSDDSLAEAKRQKLAASGQSGSILTGTLGAPAGDQQYLGA